MMIKAKEIPKHGLLVFFSHEQSHCGQQLGDDLNKLIVHILFIPGTPISSTQISKALQHICMMMLFSSLSMNRAAAAASHSSLLKLFLTHCIFPMAEVSPKTLPLDQAM